MAMELLNLWKSLTHRNDSISSLEEQRRLSCPAKVSNNINHQDHEDISEPVYGNRLEPPKLHDRKRHRQQTRILKFKDEVERVYHKFKKAGSHVKDGYEVIKARFSPSRELEDRRNIRIEYDDIKKKSRSHEALFDDYDGFDSPDHNYSPSLVIHPLKEGRFCADISLDNFPKEDNIIVRVRNYRLEILLQKKHYGKKHNYVSRPFRCGEIDLPIYVDPMSLQFTVADDCMLTIEARCKGFLSRRLSISSEDLIVKKPPRQSENPIVKRNSNVGTTKWYVTENVDKGQRLHPGVFRCRSNTR